MGALILGFGATAILWIDALTFFVSAGIIGLLIRETRGNVQGKTRRHWRAEFLQGLHFVWRDRLLLTIVGTVINL